MSRLCVIGPYGADEMGWGPAIRYTEWMLNQHRLGLVTARFLLRVVRSSHFFNTSSYVLHSDISNILQCQSRVGRPR